MYRMGRIERSVSEFHERSYRRRSPSVRPYVCIYKGITGSHWSRGQKRPVGKRIGRVKQNKLDQTIAPGGFRIREHPALTEHEREETSSRLDRNAKCGNTRPHCEKKTRRAALAQLSNFSRVYDDAREQSR